MLHQMQGVADRVDRSSIKDYPFKVRKCGVFQQLLHVATGDQFRRV
jgi:hypothetical protein